MTFTNSQASYYSRAYRLAVYFLILLSIVLVAGCRRSAEHEEPEEQVVSAVAPTTAPTVTPTATDAPTPVAEPTEEAPRADETPANATDEGGEETPTPLTTADEVGSGDAPTGTVDVTGIVEINAISVTSTLDSASEEKKSAEEKSEEPEAGNDAVGEEASSTIAAPEETTEAPTEAPVEESTAEPPAEPATEEAAPIAVPTSARPLDETVNILVLGSDRRPGAPNWRTDVIMIVALDMENGRAGVISIPRDVYVNRPPGGYSSNKINTMDYFGETDHPGGGPELLSAIIEERMGIPIHHFVRFNFETFEKVVDALSGVEVEFECSFYGDLGGGSKHKKLQLEPGVHRLDGEQAIIYVRSRAVGGDLDRAERQQRFVWSIRQQALGENLLPKLPALYSALSGSVQTDIGLFDAVRLARFVVDLEPADVHAFVVAPPDMLSYGRSRRLSYFYPYWNVIAERAQEIFDTGEFVETNEIVDGNGRECK